MDTAVSVGIRPYMRAALEFPGFFKAIGLGQTPFLQVIACFLKELLGLGDIALDLVVPALGRFERRATGEQRAALLVVFRVADIGLEERLLLQRIDDGLTGLGTKLPPQFGQTLPNTCSTQVAQNVHS